MEICPKVLLGDLMQQVIIVCEEDDNLLDLNMLLSCATSYDLVAQEDYQVIFFDLVWTKYLHFSLVF